MCDVRGPAGIRRCNELLASIPIAIIADNQIALHNKDFFPMVMNEGFLGKCSGSDAQNAGPAAGFIDLIEIAGKNLLQETRLVSGRSFPSMQHIDGEKFQMRLAMCHFHIPFSLLFLDG